jgi:hypothetical protein
MDEGEDIFTRSRGSCRARRRLLSQADCDSGSHEEHGAGQSQT